MGYKATAIVSAHIFIDEDDRKDIEILSQIDNDNSRSDIFDDIDHAILEQIEVDFENVHPHCETKSYFFMAIVKSKFVEEIFLEFIEYGVEHEVSEIKNIEDLIL